MKCRNLIDDYISNNKEVLADYELKSAKNIAIKKSNLEKEEVKNYLMKKGFALDSIDEAINS